ncbi:MAG: HD domain-containing protein [Candidatus Omnitrophica bacterium]|nr:HD domain-containing protein [Candidatus Omnitrophota bacterium]
MYIDQEKMQRIINFARAHHADEGIHRWEHIENVVGYAKHLSKYEEVDETLVTIAAYLHDIGHKYVEEPTHHFKSAQISHELLLSMNFSEEYADAVAYVIMSHRHPVAAVSKDLICYVISDADKLDMIGPDLIINAVYNVGRFEGRTYEEALEFAKHVNDSAFQVLFTETAKRIAKPENELAQEIYRGLSRKRNFMLGVKNGEQNVG